ncbi:MAG: SufE family protein [Alphaproteobacteria bacterium]|nr:SufE family protein [Alphaproteobacteria bacterium]
MTYDDMKNMLMMVDDDAVRLEILMDFGRNLEPVPDGAECSEIVGCTSFVQICRKENQFFGVADSALVRGIVAIMLALVNGKTAAQIKQMDLVGEFASLKLNLGAGRLNGVNSMIRFLQNL